MNKKSIPNDNSEEKEKKKEKENNDVNKDEEKSSGIFFKFEEPKVSLFENCFSKEAKGAIALKRFLFTEKFKKEVEKYRRSNDEELRKRIKLGLNCITPSGAFKNRKDTFIAEHSKMICIDIDAKDNRDIDLPKSKHIIGKHSPSLYYAGLSLGGEGIFLIYRISDPKLHSQHFSALAYSLREQFNLNVDSHVKSLASLRVVSYDDNPYYNPEPIPFDKIMEDATGLFPRTITQKNEIKEKVNRVIKIIMKNQIDITDRYQNWFKIACALVSEFGESGRNWFHIISSKYEKYDFSDCDIQYDRCLKQKKEEGGVTIATFFYYCKKYGIGY